MFSSALWDHMYEEEHRAFRSSVDAFVQRHVTGNIEEWEKQGHLPRSLFEEAYGLREEGGKGRKRVRVKERREEKRR